MAATANITAVITAEDRASKTLKGMSSNVRDFANKASLALGAAGAGLTLLAKSATDFTTDYVKSAKQFSRETGANIQDSSRLLHVMNRLGFSTEEASGQFGIFSKRIAASDDSFKKLGVTLTDNSGKQKDFNTILLETADKFQDMPNGINKTALSMDLFGRSGKDMIKVLNLGSEGILELQKKADKLGLTLNDQTVVRVNELIKSQKDLEDTTNSMKLAIGELTTPVLTKFNQMLNSVLQSLLGTDGAIRGLTAGVIAFGGPVLTGVAALIAFAANLGTIIQTMGVARKSFIAMRATMMTPIFLTVSITAALAAIALVYKTWLDTKRSIENSMNALKSKAKSDMEVAEKLLNAYDLGNTKKKKQVLKTAKALNIDIGAGVVSGLANYASGTNFHPGGMAVVGEQGPELVNLPRGSSVTPNNKVRSETVNFHVNIGMYAGTDIEKRKIAKALYQSLKDAMGPNFRMA